MAMTGGVVLESAHSQHLRASPYPLLGCRGSGRRLGIPPGLLPWPPGHTRRLAQAAAVRAGVLAGCSSCLCRRNSPSKTPGLTGASPTWTRVWLDRVAHLIDQRVSVDRLRRVERRGVDEQSCSTWASVHGFAGQRRGR